MTRPAPVNDIDESTLKVKEPKKAAAGIPAVKVALERGIAQAGVTRTAQSLLRLNQRGGFDCPGCAWPESHTDSASRPSSARTAPRPWPRRTPAHRGAGVLGRAFHRRAGAARPSTGWAARAGSPSRWSSARARRTTRRSPGTDAFSLIARAHPGHHAGPLRLLHLGPHRERDRVHVPAVRPVAGHQQPAGLLQHVPRVLRVSA